MTKIIVLVVWWIKYLCALESHSLLCTVDLIIRILTVIITPCSSDIDLPSLYGPIQSYTRLHHMHKISQLRILKNDQSLNLILKRDPVMPGLQISQSRIPGLKIQSRDCNHSCLRCFYHSLLLLTYLLHTAVGLKIAAMSQQWGSARDVTDFPLCRSGVYVCVCFSASKLQFWRISERRSFAVFVLRSLEVRIKPTLRIAGCLLSRTGSDCVAGPDIACVPAQEFCQRSSLCMKLKLTLYAFL